MIKLYRMDVAPKTYWEAWENDDGGFTVHFGELGSRGTSEIVRNGLFRKAKAVIDAEAAKRLNEGYAEAGEPQGLTVEYAIDGFGNPDDLEKRHALEDRLNETLGWTGLGHCDGGSIGSGTMEVFCIVVDGEIASAVVNEDLENTEFGDYARIFIEDISA